MADLKETQRITKKAKEALEKSMTKVEPRFANLIIDWVTKFETSSGNISRSKRNRTRIAGFKKAVNRFVIESGYQKVVSNFIASYPLISDELRDIHEDLNDIDIKKSVINVYQQGAIDATVNNMVGDGLNTMLVNPIRNQLNVAVMNGASLTDTIKSLETQLKTTQKSQGLLKRIATQASRDALGQYEGVVNEGVRKEFKLDAILYIGSIVKDTRPQCIRWVNWDKHGKKGLLLFNELGEQIQWADNNGTGFIEDTTPETFCQNRGGYNCRHTCYPVRSSVYIKEDG